MVATIEMIFTYEISMFVGWEKRIVAWNQKMALAAYQRSCIIVVWVGFGKSGVVVQRAHEMPKLIGVWVGERFDAWPLAVKESHFDWRVCQFMGVGRPPESWWRVLNAQVCCCLLAPLMENGPLGCITFSTGQCFPWFKLKS